MATPDTAISGGNELTLVVKTTRILPDGSHAVIQMV